MNDKLTSKDMPKLVRAAGDDAVRVYREFFNDPNWNPAKRTVSRCVVARFCRWAAARGLTLETIDPSDVKAYLAKAPERCLAPVGELLRRLAATGAITGQTSSMSLRMLKAAGRPRTRSAE
jgi:hypothetical protein